MSEIKTQRLHATIEGRVQGVGFRYFVIILAEQNALNGWVGNQLDGSVEVIAEGTLEALNSLLKALRQGPRSARVDTVNYEWSEANGEFQGFNLRGRF
ncbi:MAG: acylphosphatase [Chloroflexota bacterium]